MTDQDVAITWEDQEEEELLAGWGADIRVEWVEIFDLFDAPPAAIDVRLWPLCSCYGWPDRPKDGHSPACPHGGKEPA